MFRKRNNKAAEATPTYSQYGLKTVPEKLSASGLWILWGVLFVRSLYPVSV